ncbi:hypothetical protein Tsubulata_046684 [Turnera subulata]|uniref:MORF/ORRM1/DAG-like MORF domain-containing protein n=1 Tax=Turnera subulata TaxID=218843 RepID=A0A9Q0FAZ3_9ROSI|nr:hypothetical protein Tsubulata_046684 [Turnera subulata]
MSPKYITHQIFHISLLHLEPPKSDPSPKTNQMLHTIIKKPLTLTAAALRRRYRPSTSPCGFSSSPPPNSLYFSPDSATENSPKTQQTELTRLPSLLQGCDYEHWVVIMQPPRGYPPRGEIVDGYIKTLAMALGSEEEAKKAIYSVSTKYYYAFGCKVTEDLTCKIKSLPDVRWVLLPLLQVHLLVLLAGEPYIDGKVVPYDDKYHKHWIQDQDNESYASISHVKKNRRRRKKSSLD